MQRYPLYVDVVRHSDATMQRRARTQHGLGTSTAPPAACAALSCAQCSAQAQYSECSMGLPTCRRPPRKQVARTQRRESRHARSDCCSSQHIIITPWIHPKRSARKVLLKQSISRIPGVCSWLTKFGGTKPKPWYSIYLQT